MNDRETAAMLINHMGRGFLENIIALVRQEPETARFIPDMVADEQIMVRLGATALVEELARDPGHGLSNAVPGLLALLASGSATVRGDAAYLLGVIGDPAARGALRGLLQDANAAVREIAADALAEQERKGPVTE